MYIVAIAWFYVVLMMAISEKSFVAGALTLILYGLLPLGILAMIGRRRRPRSDEAGDDRLDQQDRPDAEGNK